MCQHGGDHGAVKAGELLRHPVKELAWCVIVPGRNTGIVGIDARSQRSLRSLVQGQAVHVQSAAALGQLPGQQLQR